MTQAYNVLLRHKPFPQKPFFFRNKPTSRKREVIVHSFLKIRDRKTEREILKLIQSSYAFPPIFRAQVVYAGYGIVT